jgi:hypothetical protein
MDPGFAKSGLGALETSSNYLSGVSDTLQNNLFSMEGLKAAFNTNRSRYNRSSSS